jgi:hypothetical protein
MTTTTQPTQGQPLEPCPFCGAEGYLAEIDGYRPSSPKTYRVMCGADDCNIQGLEFSAETDAISWWNLRAANDLAQRQAQQVEFWKNMALGLKDEMVVRGNRIVELETKVSVLEESCNALGQALLGAEDDDDEPGCLGTVDWVGPSGKTWKVDLYQEDDDNE